MASIMISWSGELNDYDRSLLNRLFESDHKWDITSVGHEIDEEPLLVPIGVGNFKNDDDGA